MSISQTHAKDLRWFVDRVLAELWKARDAKATGRLLKAIAGSGSGSSGTVTHAEGESRLTRAVLDYASGRSIDIKPAPDFDEHKYLCTYPDVREQVQSGALTSGFVHYVQHGRHEGRVRPLLTEPARVRTSPIPRATIQQLFLSGDLPLCFGVVAGGAGTVIIRFNVPPAGANVLLEARGAQGQILRTSPVAEGKFEVTVPREGGEWVLAIFSNSPELERLEGLVVNVTSAGPEVQVGANADYAELRASGIFDPVWYARYGVDPSASHAFDHYWFLGRSRGYQPCFYFEPGFYLERNADVRRNGIDPALHYVRFGEAQGRMPGPMFDPAWYSSRYGLGAGSGLALAHYLSHRQDGRDPCADFDVAFHFQHNPDLKLAGVDPVEHYVLWGYRENRNPSPEFDTRLYVQLHLGGSYDQNPLVHYILHGRPAGVPLPGHDGAHRGVAGEVKKFSAAGPNFEEWQPPKKGGRAPRAKVVAFYLPQFHRFEENDNWWGTGFTEWTNLSRGLPRCRGHYQPRTPRDLGFYDLTDPEAIRRQVSLAQAAGLHGFCFYFYWFNKKRLLEKPLDLFVNDPAIDFPFCLMWANENWTRRWDGLEQEILLEQRYDPDHDEDLVATLASYFKSPRYMRAGGRPIFSIYRPDKVPDARERFAHWRELWRTRHDLDPIFLMAQSFDNVDPASCGLDGALEFPPHHFIRQCTPARFADIEILDPGFAGAFYQYEDLARAGMAPTATRFPLVKTVSPSWDNDARRQGTGNAFLNSTPALYERWLRHAIDHARAEPLAGEPIVFVNAWNEWAEAAYLEPDVHVGAAYLNATARAIYDLSDTANAEHKILLVGHDAHAYGAQSTIMSIARTLRRQFGMAPTLLLLDGGPLVAEYEAICPTVVLPRTASARARILAGLASDGYRTAITNTTVSGELAPLLSHAGIRFITLIHELPRFVAERGLERNARLIADQAHAIVFPHAVVRDGFLKTVGGSCVGSLVIRPQGSYNAHRPSEHARTSLRQRLGLDPDARIVLNVGRGDLRKGFDLFVGAARQTAAAMSGVHFVWLGKIEPDIALWLMPQADDPVLGGRFHHLPFESDPQAVMEIIGGADLFFLSSREDPYPTVVLEAFAAGLDLLAYGGGGGFADLVGAHGKVLESSEPALAAEAIGQLLSSASAEEIARRREARRPFVEDELSPDRYCADLLKLVDPKWRRVTVIVPNFNYGKHLRARLGSIFDQTYPVFEVIVLDDASTDDSLRVIENISAEFQREVQVISNQTNSGSAFRQWRKGLEAARGELVWVAEADDISAPTFLATVVEALNEGNAAFAFCDSWQLDEKGRRIGESYATYCNDGRDDGRFNRDFVLPGAEFVSEHLSVKNTILNASAVVWRRDALAGALDAVGESLDGYRVAGDWRLYVQAALANEAVAYVSRALNGHRRHGSSVTHALDKQRHLGEIVRVHRILEEAMPLDPSIVRAMRDYEADVAAQFGLGELRT